MLPAAEGWRLPVIRTEDSWLSNAAKIIVAVRAAYDLPCDFTVLRYVAIEINEQERWDRLLLVLEPRQPLEYPPLAGQWIDHSQLRDLALAEPDQREPLLRYLEENEQGPDSPLIDQRRSPWARPGWFASAAAWIEEAIRELGYVQSSPVQQLRNWSISSLLYVPTSDGKLYLKAASALPLFVNEPLLTQILSHLFPEEIPAVVKIDRERRWMLMCDFAPAKWQQPVDLAPIMRAYAAMQRTSAGHINKFFAATCRDRRLAVLSGQIDLLIADPETRAALSDEQYATLVEMAPDLKRRCAAVAECNIPATLIHGDLHLGNITQRSAGYLFFDWTDACIAFPFLDLFQLYFYDTNKGARDAYLECWRDLESPPRLLELWELAKPLCALHHAVSYLSIIHNIEPRTVDELFHGFPDNLHNLLAAMRK
jgi:hypothetical protein